MVEYTILALYIAALSWNYLLAYIDLRDKKKDLQLLEDAYEYAYGSKPVRPEKAVNERLGCLTFAGEKYYFRLLRPVEKWYYIERQKKFN